MDRLAAWLDGCPIICSVGLNINQEDGIVAGVKYQGLLIYWVCWEVLWMGGEWSRYVQHRQEDGGGTERSLRCFLILNPVGMT